MIASRWGSIGVLVMATAGALVGCAKATAWPPEPGEVRFGEDACANCRMVVSDERFAAQAVTRTGETRAYDDLGCLLEAARAAAIEVEGVYVRAFDGAAGVRGDRGFAIRAADIQTPMGFGFAAFASRDSADAEAARHESASVHSLADLVRTAAAEAPPAHK